MARGGFSGKLLMKLGKVAVTASVLVGGLASRGVTGLRDFVCFACVFAVFSRVFCAFFRVFSERASLLSISYWVRLAKNSFSEPGPPGWGGGGVEFGLGGARHGVRFDYEGCGVVAAARIFAEGGSARPTLGSVNDIGNLDRSIHDSIDHDEGQGRQGQLACSSDATLSASVREGPNCAGTVVDLSHGTLRRDRLRRCAHKQRPGLRRLPGASGSASRFVESGSEHAFDPLSHLFVREEFASVKLLQTGAHFPAEPCVVVEVGLRELLNVFFRGASIFGGDAVQPGFERGTEANFHGLADRDSGRLFQ
jgi:hypothetical protein